MGIFGDQAERLLRESWPSVDQLAEELYAIFTSTSPLQVDGPLTINNKGSGSPIVINQSGGNHDLVQITRQDPGLPGFGPIPPNPAPGQTFYTFYYDNFPPEYFNPPFGPPNNEQGTGTPIVPPGVSQFPGQVVSGGPGQGPYTVKVYTKGLAGLPTTAQATALQLASDATLPPGTWGFFTPTTTTKVGGTTYLFQPAVWLDPPQGGP